MRYHKTYLKSKCTIGITWTESVVLYSPAGTVHTMYVHCTYIVPTVPAGSMCQLPKAQIHYQYLMKRILQFSVKPGASCPNMTGNGHIKILKVTKFIQLLTLKRNAKTPILSCKLVYYIHPSLNIPLLCSHFH